MSKIRDVAGLLLVPVGLAIVKRVADKIPQETTPIVPLIPELPKDTSIYPDLIVREKTKLVIQPSADIPFFPETAVTAGKEFAAKDPFAGLAGLESFPTFTGFTGLLSPEAQANIRKYQAGLK